MNNNKFTHCGSCNNYQDKTIIQERILQEGEQYEFITEEDSIVFILKGSVQLSFDTQIDIKVESPHMIIIPSGSFYAREASNRTTLIQLPIKQQIETCDCLLIESNTPQDKILTKASIQEKEYLYPLPPSPIILEHLNLLIKSISQGLSCIHLINLKIKELIFIIRINYPEEERLKFFSPLISSDRIFSEFIHKTYRKVGSIKELAEQSYYSLSGFDKRFRRVFGKSASQWMKERRAADIYRDIKKGEKTFKQISLEYGFCSPAHFNDFCKSKLGNTPGRIRKEDTNEHIV